MWFIYIIIIMQYNMLRLGTVGSRCLQKWIKNGTNMHEHVALLIVHFWLSILSARDSGLHLSGVSWGPLSMLVAFQRDLHRIGKQVWLMSQLLIIQNIESNSWWYAFQMLLSHFLIFFVYSYFLTHIIPSHALWHICIAAAVFVWLQHLLGKYHFLIIPVKSW